MERLERLVLEYQKQFPDANTPLDYLCGIGFDQMEEILENRNGRRVEFIEGEGLDEVEFRYVE